MKSSCSKHGGIDSWQERLAWVLFLRLGCLMGTSIHSPSFPLSCCCRTFPCAESSSSSYSASLYFVFLPFPRLCITADCLETIFRDVIVVHSHHEVTSYSIDCGAGHRHCEDLALQNNSMWSHGRLAMVNHVWVWPSTNAQLKCFGCLSYRNLACGVSRKLGRITAGVASYIDKLV